ncbi:MAG TPA: discoidin domain-containing protein, partial [Pseudolabrys sp.]|nr:discoidin domain-containing protein [Pseudolabrys sp.]
AAEAGVADDLLMTPARTRDAVDLTFALLQMQAADSAALPMFWGSRFADSFKTLTYVDVAGATNLDSSVAGVLKPTVTPGAAQIPTMTGATTGGVTISASSDQPAQQAWKVANNNLTDAAGVDWASQTGVIPSPGAPVTLHVDLGSSQLIMSYELAASGWSSNSAQNYMLKDWVLQGSTDGSSWSTIDTRTGVPAWSPAESRTYQITTPSSYRHYRLYVTATQNGNIIICGKLQLFPAGTTDNLTVASATLAAAASPASAKLVAQYNPADDITLGTDLMFDVSRDGGTTWSAVTMTDRFTSPSPVAEGDADLSGQPVGSDMKWRVRSANAKAFELHGVALSW